MRTDIQGLRAIAVSLVLIYHLAPKTLTGGFVGVDVFFVISGFLITLHLLGRVPGGPRDLAAFWSRRIRRLLPASLLVLSTTLVASRLFAPETQWANTARQTRAAALYVVNWVLSGDAVDYLAAKNAASPVQHFWSLSVEEQFYFVWPVLILLLGLLARKLRSENSLHLILGGLVLVVAASLAYSIHITATNPAAAYFVTPARVWELGIGGILATLHLITPGNLRELIAVPLSWIGLAAIAYSALTYSDSTPFPGWQAAVPVLGTAAVIGAHSMHGHGSPGTFLAFRPVQWLGDVSYSVYLWHWPLVVILPQATGHALTWPERGCIVIATLGLASLTKTHVEDRFRTARWGNPLPKPFALAGLAMTVVIAGAGIQLHEVNQRAEAAQAEQKTALDRIIADKDPCLGARALDHPGTCPKVSYADLVPRPVEAPMDRSAAYDTQAATGTDCWSYKPNFPVKTCTFGVKSSPTTVVVVGNSHAGQWLPALQILAKRYRFKIVTLLASACVLSDVSQELDTADQSAKCLRWVNRIKPLVTSLKPELVLMSDRIAVPVTGHTEVESRALYVQGYRDVLRPWSAAGIKVLALHDTPYPGINVPDCISTAEGDYQRCDGTAKNWIKYEPVKKAIASMNDPDLRYADLNDHICAGAVCHVVNGGVITYFDESHISATYAASLAPYLDEVLAPMLPR